MNVPVQQHYLPVSAYLKFFECPEKEGFIYLYQRNKEPVLVNCSKVAKQRHLYSFVDEDGEINTEIEKALEQVEQNAIPILKNLNEINSPISITMKEKNLLCTFTAFQYMRTPAFRETMKQMGGFLVKMEAKAMAFNKSTLEDVMRKCKEEQPNFSEDIDTNILRDFIMNADYSIKLTDSHSLLLTMKMAPDIFRLVMLKKFAVLKLPENLKLVTCDHPVILVYDSSPPPHMRHGLFGSGLVFPIGSGAALHFWDIDENMDGKTLPENFIIPVHKLEFDKGQELNACTISHAENYVFYSEKNHQIETLFSQTQKPERLRVSAPF